MSYVTIRAFTKDGYHKDIASVSHKQVHMKLMSMPEPYVESAVEGNTVVIVPADFPEVVRFEVIVEREP